VLLHKHDGLLHGFDLLDCFILNHLNISQVSHYLHESSFFWGSICTLGNNFDSFGYLMNEMIDVFNLLHSVVKNEASMSLDPCLNSFLKLFDQRHRVNSKPTNVYWGLHFSNLTFDGCEMWNLFIEDFQSWESCYNSLQNLLAHPVKCFLLIVKFLIFIIVARSQSIKFFSENLFKRLAWIQKLLERYFKFLLPKELFVIVLVDEVIGCFFNFI